MAQSEYTFGSPSRPVGELLDRAYLGFTQPASTYERWLATPTPTVTVILNLGEPFGGLPPSFVAGLTDTYGIVDQGGAITCVELKLSPLGAYTLLGTPMDELSDLVVNLDDVLGASSLTDRLAAEPTWQRRFDLLDTFLLDRLDTGPQPADEVAWAWHRLTETRGAVPVGALAAEVGWSRRHLVTKFREQVGLPPKTMARIVRFQQLLNRLTIAGPLRWTQLAAECGYYDQAHMIRDFREFAGTTPTDYVARLVPAGPDLTSVQYTWVPAA